VIAAVTGGSLVAWYGGVAYRLALLVAMSACAAADPGSSDGEPADYDPVDWSGGKADSSGVPATFDKNLIVTDKIFTATNAVTGDAVQKFLEDSPYGTRSWLADATVGGARFSDAIVLLGQQNGVDPIILLARAQVESSLVSATEKPSKARLDIALGCGCPDGARCDDDYYGLGNQIRCAGQVLTARAEDSANRAGTWIAGDAHSTSDHYKIVPANNSTAAMYAYTPWVFPGKGGNWLVWNVTRKFLKHFDDAGTLTHP
jgi:hypothetical protein